MVKLINPERSSGLAEPQSSNFTNKVHSPILATSSALVPEEKALQFDEANNGCNNPPLLGNLNLGTADEASLLAADDDGNPFSPKGPITTQNPLLPFEALGRRTPSPLEHAQRGDSQAEEEKVRRCRLTTA